MQGCLGKKTVCKGGPEGDLKIGQVLNCERLDFRAEREFIFLPVHVSQKKKEVKKNREKGGTQAGRRKRFGRGT